MGHGDSPAFAGAGHMPSGRAAQSGAGYRVGTGPGSPGQGSPWRCSPGGIAAYLMAAAPAAGHVPAARRQTCRWHIQQIHAPPCLCCTTWAITRRAGGAVCGFRLGQVGQQRCEVRDPLAGHAVCCRPSCHGQSGPRRPRRRRSRAARSSIAIGHRPLVPPRHGNRSPVCRRPLAGIVRICVSALTPQPLNKLTEPVRRSGRVPPHASWSTPQDGASGGN